MLAQKIQVEMHGGFNKMESVVQKEAEATRQAVARVRRVHLLAVLSARPMITLDAHTGYVKQSYRIVRLIEIWPR